MSQLQKLPDSYYKLSGLQKAAIMILSLDHEKASKLLGELEEDEIRDVSQAMVKLGSIKSNIVEGVCVDFVERMTKVTSIIGSYESTERLLKKTLQGDAVKNIMEEIRGPAGKTMWDKLANVNEVVLASYLKNEYPQTVAVILSKIKPDHAAKVLAELPENYSMEVIMRMLRMENVQKEIILDIENTLKTEFMSNLTHSSQRDPHEIMAEIFNGFDRTTESRFLSALEERNGESAEKIKSLMFTFEDLVKLDPQSIQTLLRVADKEKLSLALKGGTEELKNLFFTNMSERAAKIMKEDMENMGPVRLKEVEEAQSAIVGSTKELAEKGEIQINSGNDEDELVY